MKRKICQRTIFIFLMIMCSAAVSYAQSMTTAEAQAYFQKGNALYKAGKFAEACLEYESISAAGLVSGEIYFNIGNCYARRGMMGRALVYYERARLRIPHDSDLKVNDAFVRSQLALTEGTQGIWKRVFEGINEACSVNMLGVILSIVYVCLFVCVGLSIAYARLRRVMAMAILVMITVATVGGFAWYSKIRYIKRGAIVITNNVPVRFEPAEAGTVYCTLPEGSRIEVLEFTGGWAKVLRSDGKIGWIEKSTFEKITP